MEVTTKELRIQPGKILEQVSIGQEVTVTYRGRPLAKIVPIQSVVGSDAEESALFGLWRSREDTATVDEYLRSVRKGREF